MIQAFSKLYTWFDPQPKKSGIVYFDGVCSVCNGFVDFLITRDENQSLQYATLQGKTAKKKLNEELYANIDSIIFQQGEKTHSKSNAALMVISSLGGFWKFAIFLRLIPKFIRDAVYNLIAKNRYQWFGKNDFCRIATEQEKEIILD